MDGSPRRDFFISYTACDVAWAQWIAATLEQAGYTVWFQPWDFRPGGDFIQLMHRAVQESDRVIAVLSPSYFGSAFGTAEWATVLAQDPTGEKSLLLPVRVEHCKPRGLLTSRIYIDLTDCADPQTARDILLGGVIPHSAPRRPPVTFPHADLTAPGATEKVEESGDQPAFPGSESRDNATTPSVQERTPWEWLRRHRPSVTELLDERTKLLGHRKVQQAIRSRIETLDTAGLVLLTGPAGSGKSALVSWLHDVAPGRVVDAGERAEHLSRPLSETGRDVGRLLRELRSDLEQAGEHGILVYDDVDHELKEPGIARLIQQAIAQPHVGYIVLTMSTPLTPQLFPVPVTELLLDRRRAEHSEFQRFLDRVLDAAGCSRETLGEDLRRSLHDMSEHTANFRALQYVLEMLIAHHLWTREVEHAFVLKQFLDDDPYARRFELPAVRTTRGRNLAFRRRDKSELLTQVLLRRFPSPGALASAADGTLDGFDAAGFLGEADQSFTDAVVSLCLTNSPRDLLHLLSSTAIRAEIQSRHLDPEQLFDTRAEEVDLLVRGLGFTLVAPPTGLNAFKSAVQAAKDLAEEDEGPKVNAAGKSVVHHVDAALLDLLHFWATYLFGSVGDLTAAARARRPGVVIDERRFGTRQVVELLHFLNDAALEEGSPFRLALDASLSPVPAPLLHAADGFVTAAEGFERLPRSSRGDADSMALRAGVDAVVCAADGVLEASEGSFPAVIKLSEIVFDEYSRKIFHGVDSDGESVRFALTGDEEAEELVVTAHYFMLPRKRVSVDPHIVPRGGSRGGVLFDRADEYEASSTTQRNQATRLLELADLRRDDAVVDVGSGTGAITLSIAGRVRRVHGIDNSPEMVRAAQRRALGAASSNVTFEVVDLFDYVAHDAFDVVLSNATMHWVLPPDRAYQCLFRLLRRGGRLAVHQGGHGTYRGLHAYTSQLLNDLDLADYFVGWRYPLYYPTAEQFGDLLAGVGFKTIKVTAVASDGSEYPNLVRDFSEAGLLPYLKQLPDVHRESFRAIWLEEAVDSAPDLYTNRLYVAAVKP